mmetsp:Transcript_38542/g.56570  ORF Transcript_38542/g.56570 Transcript_38542/m.56570 type:complete len:450 (+) Transcript_38542:78-1427(+)
MNASDSSPYQSGRGRDAVGHVPPTFANWAHKVFQLPSSSFSSSCIYLGPFQSANANSHSVEPCPARQSILLHNVTAIVNCTQDAPCCHPDLVEYCRVPIRDEVGADILPYLWGVTSFIHVHLSGQRKRMQPSTHEHEQPEQSQLQQNSSSSHPPQSVLVHCEMGVSRSTTVVLAYLIRYQNMTKEDAYKLVKNRRPQANPNVGFWKQLGEFEKMVQSGKGNASENINSVNEEYENESTLIYEWAKRSSATFITTVGDKNSIHLLHGGEKAQPNNKLSDGNTTTANFVGGEEQIQQDVFSQHSHLLLRSGILQNSNSSSSKTTKPMEKLLSGALDYVWSRGVLDVDLFWFVALVDFLERQSSDMFGGGGDGDTEPEDIMMLLSSSSTTIKSSGQKMNETNTSSKNKNYRDNINVRALIMDILKEGSAFRESWTGEVYENQIHRVKGVLLL